MLRRVLRSRKGQGLVEYALLIGGISMVCIIAVSFFGVRVANLLVAQAGTLPANSNSALNTPVDIGAFIETEADGSSFVLDGDQMETNRAAPSNNRFINNLAGTNYNGTADFADNYYDGTGGLVVSAAND